LSPEDSQDKLDQALDRAEQLMALCEGYLFVLGAVSSALPDPVAAAQLHHSLPPDHTSDVCTACLSQEIATVVSTGLRSAHGVTGV